MSKITEDEARVLFDTGHPVSLVRADGARLSHWASCATGWARTFDDFRAAGLQYWKVGDDPAHWEKPSPRRQTHDEAAGYIFRREPFEVGNVSGSPYVNSSAPGYFGDLPQTWVTAYEAHDRSDPDGYAAVSYVVWSYETVIAWVYGPEGTIVMPPVRYSNTTTQHQWLVARALGVPFTTTESAREGKGKTPYTSRSGW